MTVVPPDLEQLRKSLASGLMYPGPMQDAASFLLSLVDEGGRLVVEKPCEHGSAVRHRISKALPHVMCPGGSRMQVWPDKGGEVSVFAKFAKDVIKTVADFEEAAARFAADLGVNADDLKQRAADLSPVSLMGPIEALRHLADKEEE